MASCSFCTTRYFSSRSLISMTLFISSSSSWSICCFFSSSSRRLASIACRINSSSARYSASSISRVTTGRALTPVGAGLLAVYAT